jgi:hypothetical protein
LAFGGAIFNRLPALRSRIPGHFLGDRLDITPQVVEQLLMSPRPASSAPVGQGTTDLHHQTLTHYRERQSLIEAHVWELMKERSFPTHLAYANAQLGRNIIAALTLATLNLSAAYHLD